MTPIERRSSRQAGFTLLEVMIVVAVVAILALILIPNFNSARAQAQASACESNLRSIATAAELYYADTQVYPANGPVTITAFTPSGSSTSYLDVQPRDPAASAASTYAFTGTIDATTGVPSYTIVCPGPHITSSLSKLPGYTSGDVHIQYSSGSGLGSHT